MTNDTSETNKYHLHYTVPDSDAVELRHKGFRRNECKMIHS